MLPVIAKLKLATAIAAGWTASASPVPVLGSDVVISVGGVAAAPVPVALYDENDHQAGTVAIWRDGWTDDDTTIELKHLFRCRTTHREHALAPRTLAMLADISEKWGKTIEYVSVYRVGGGESGTSPHRGARAIDFRIRGVPLRDIRDYVWRTYSDVGVGWYPSEQFIHIDSRPGLHDTAWTFVNGDNHYNPYWAELARKPDLAASQTRGPKS